MRFTRGHQSICSIATQKALRLLSVMKSGCRRRPVASQNNQVAASTSRPSQIVYCGMFILEPSQCALFRLDRDDMGPTAWVDRPAATTVTSKRRPRIGESG